MKTRYLASLPFVVFLASIMLSVMVVESRTQILTETRKSALVASLSQTGFFAKDPYGTAQILYVLKMINALNVVDVEKGLSRILSMQNLTIGNQTLWGWPELMDNLTYVTELYVPYVITNCLKLLDALDRLNKTALINVVMTRYNESNGAFFEPMIAVDTGYGTKEYAVCVFPLEFHAESRVAYAGPNMISTFLGVSILADLGVLSMINVTKTQNWILACKADNEAFMPFPEARPEYLPSWSSLRTNPFYVDGYGTGVAYTYAALGSLRALDVEIKSVVNVERIKEYLLSCQQTYPSDTIRFLAYPEADDTPAFHLTYYALTALHYIGALDEERSVATKVTAYILRWLQDDYLRFDNSWPVPTRSDVYYGLFVGFVPSTTTYFAVTILNMTSNLNVLDQLTPIVSKTWGNLVVLSLIVSISATGLSLGGILTYTKIQQRRQKK